MIRHSQGSAGFGQPGRNAFMLDHAGLAFQSRHAALHGYGEVIGIDLRLQKLGPDVPFNLGIGQNGPVCSYASRCRRGCMTRSRQSDEQSQREQ